MKSGIFKAFATGITLIIIGGCAPTLQKQRLVIDGLLKEEYSNNDGAKVATANKKLGAHATALNNPDDHSDDVIDMVQVGDIVSIDCSASLETGQLFYTTTEAIAKDVKRKKVLGYQEPISFEPLEVLAGKSALLPGVEMGILGARVGEKKTLIIPSDKAYAPPNPKDIMQFPTRKTMPMVIKMSAEEYVKQFGSFPDTGIEVDLVPYFKGRVIEVSQDYAMIKCLAKDGQISEDDFGTTTIQVDEDEITLVLSPRIGAPFTLNGRKGWITYTDGSSFTVDFNSPMAGKELVIDIQVVSIEKASKFASLEIPWIEDHSMGLEQARVGEKPVLLLLYAQWCTWSKRLTSEVFEDPRIKRLKDEFIWVRIDSDIHREFYELYDQHGYPLIVLLMPDGEIIKKVDGFKDAQLLQRELSQALIVNGKSNKRFSITK